MGGIGDEATGKQLSFKDPQEINCSVKSLVLDPLLILHFCFFLTWVTSLLHASFVTLDCKILTFLPLLEEFSTKIGCPLQCTAGFQLGFFLFFFTISQDFAIRMEMLILDKKISVLALSSPNFENKGRLICWDVEEEACCAFQEEIFWLFIFQKKRIGSYKNFSKEEVC